MALTIPQYMLTGDDTLSAALDAVRRHVDHCAAARRHYEHAAEHADGECAEYLEKWARYWENRRYSGVLALRELGKLGVMPEVTHEC